MSVDTETRQGNGLAPSSTQRETTQASGDTLPKDATAQKDAVSTTDNTSNAQDENKPSNQTPTSASTPTSHSSFLGSLWSPISSLQKSILGYTSTQDDATSNASPQKNEVREATVSMEHQANSTWEIPPKGPDPKQPPSSSTSPDSKTTTLSSTDLSSNTSSPPITTLKPNPTPSPILPPTNTPTYLRLAKSRLSGTRTKQLLRAGSRAYNDPPPPPELGACCGSSCDPCVNDLWREERSVWREVWGGSAVENRDKRGERLEW